MVKKKIVLIAACLLSISLTFSQERLIYHVIKTDASKNILPWYNPAPGISYDHVLGLVWNFWDTMRRDINGIPYYMNHQIWQAGVNESKGIGGDQFGNGSFLLEIILPIYGQRTGEREYEIHR
jgi:hypothetical protein